MDSRLRICCLSACNSCASLNVIMTGPFRSGPILLAAQANCYIQEPAGKPANSLLQVCAGRLLLRWRVSRTHVVIRFVVPPVLRPVILTEPRLRLAQGRFSSVRQ